MAIIMLYNQHSQLITRGTRVRRSIEFVRSDKISIKMETAIFQKNGIKNWQERTST